MLAIVIATRGSAPQVPGASALFSEEGLLTGTLGGGIMEGDATRRASEIHGSQASLVYGFDLDADISSGEGAICGGSSTLLLDADPGKSLEVFKELGNALSAGKDGVLVTLLEGADRVEVRRFWAEQGKARDPGLPVDWQELEEEIAGCAGSGTCRYLIHSDRLSAFLEPVHPLPRLIIAGAGHIGKALAHLGSLLDFEVTVLDDREEYANPVNIPDADRLIVEPVGRAMGKLKPGRDACIVIVTRGHRDDTEALRACIGWDVPYIGMIGSRNKVRTMRENFLSSNWATPALFDRVHAPVGLEIGSKTVQEIAVSIAAELIQVRSAGDKYHGRSAGKASHLVTLVLAAGESSRMGKPKMLLPFGELSIIETVVTNASRSATGKVLVVLGASHQAIGSGLRNYAVETVLNAHYREGMFSSVQCGLRALPGSTEGVLILLGDQPMIGTGVMNDMIDRFRKSDSGILVAACQGRRGHPVLIGSRYFSELLEFPSGSSLRQLLERHPEDIEELETRSPEILRDIDTEKDYREELKHHHKHD